MKSLFLLINSLFYIKQESVKRKHTPEQRFKFNNLNFGENIEDILTRLMKGEKADASFLPNNYVPRLKEESNEAA